MTDCNNLTRTNNTIISTARRKAKAPRRLSVLGIPALTRLLAIEGPMVVGFKGTPSFGLYGISVSVAKRSTNAASFAAMNWGYGRNA